MDRKHRKVDKTEGMSGRWN